MNAARGMQRRIVPWCAGCAAVSVSAVVLGCWAGAPGAARAMVGGELAGMVVLVVAADRFVKRLATLRDTCMQNP